MFFDALKIINTMSKTGAIAFIFIIAITSNYITAQEPDKAKALLEQVSEKIQAYDNIVIDFKNVLINTEENIKHETRGNVSLSSEKYLLNFSGITRLFDGNKIYTIIPENEEITISNPSETEQAETAIVTPSALFNFYKKGYNYQWDALKDISGRKIQYIKLIPKDINSELEYLLLGIDITTKHIYNLINVGKDKVKTTLTVNSFKTNQPLSSQLFTFDKTKYDGYYINN